MSEYNFDGCTDEDLRKQMARNDKRITFHRLLIEQDEDYNAAIQAELDRRALEGQTDVEIAHDQR